MQDTDNTSYDIFELVKIQQRTVYTIHYEPIDYQTFKPLNHHEIEEIAMQVRMAVDQKREWMALDQKVWFLQQLFNMNIDKVQADGGWDFIFSVMPELCGLTYEEQENLKQQLLCIWPQYSQQDIEIHTLQKTLSNNYLYGQHRSLINQWEQSVKSLRVYVLSTQIGFVHQFLKKLKVVYLPFEFMTYCELQEGDRMYVLRPRSKRLLKVVLQLLRRDFSQVNFIIDDSLLFKVQDAKKMFCRSKVEDRVNKPKICSMLNFLFNLQAKMSTKNRRDGLPNLKSLFQVDQEQHLNVWTYQVEVDNDDAEMGNSDCEDSFPEYHNHGPTYYHFDQIDQQLFESVTESSQNSQRSDSSNRYTYY